MFRVRTHDPKPLLWWFNHRERIDLDPTYQRRSNIWSATKQAFLIDSFLNDYDMPKLYLADFTAVNTDINERARAYAVIDGKQRLQAIFKFFRGELKLSKDFILESDASVKIGGLDYPTIKLRFPSLASKVEDHIPTVMSVVTDEPEKIHQLFVRLNSGVHANAAERRNAMSGIVPDLIRGLVSHAFFRKKIKFDISRMSEFNVAAKLLLIEYRGKFTDTKAANLDRFVRDGEKDRPGVRRAAKQVKTVLDVMARIFHDRDPLLLAAGSIPIYYWLVREYSAKSNQIRDFLDRHAEGVRRNQAIIKKDPDAGDAELSQYYTMGRTTNDQGSLAGRYDILRRRFKAYLRRDPDKTARARNAS